eukprot:CAMPEP_0178975662 /NCGR_PEP_ID=MMETSP0789-20121207/23320_1 /TAXON_ID=3005 /ORGANISM="Rhizosolenia setigera, Strain CCMP 1694" /LENGTH=61 /DNA_ID=CAMNT_0020664499 /DNA_START=53 /DNA_END=235 /DNA_ORIENTATION=-
MNIDDEKSVYGNRDIDMGEESEFAFANFDERQRLDYDGDINSSYSKRKDFTPQEQELQNQY